MNQLIHDGYDGLIRRGRSRQAPQKHLVEHGSVSLALGAPVTCKKRYDRRIERLTDLLQRQEPVGEVRSNSTQKRRSTSGVKPDAEGVHTTPVFQTNGTG